MIGRAILVTGGAGFIGSHLVDRLLQGGYAVRVLDALLPQVHPGGRPDYLARDAELLIGDVRDPAVVERAVQGIDVVVHLAAAGRRRAVDVRDPPVLRHQCDGYRDAP